MGRANGAHAADDPARTAREPTTCSICCSRLRTRRDALIEHLSERGILAVFHYLPLHLSEMGRRWGGRAGDCPVTESVSERLVRLPFYTSLSEQDQERVIEAVRAAR